MKESAVRFLSMGSSVIASIANITQGTQEAAALMLRKLDRATIYPDNP
jgi:hypothetical protein